MSSGPVDRRLFIKLGTVSTLAAGLGIAGWRKAFSANAVVGPSPYGPLGSPDANGVALPAGFSARLLATTGQTVAGTTYPWHGEPDGGSCFADPAGGGWVYVSNSELNGRNGGAGALKFRADGSVASAYAILGGTKWNCAGGATPWRTWLSCEEHRAGYRVGVRPLRARPGCRATRARQVSTRGRGRRSRDGLRLPDRG